LFPVLVAQQLGIPIWNYSIGSIYLTDYLKESGYNLTEHVRNELRKTVLRIKKTHFIKNQGQGKAPMMYADLKIIIDSTPDDYY
jgi:hypothetical protein